MNGIIILGVALQGEKVSIDYVNEATVGREAISITSEELARPEFGRAYLTLKDAIKKELNISAQKELVLQKINFKWVGGLIDTIRITGWLVEEGDFAEMRISAKLIYDKWGWQEWRDYRGQKRLDIEEECHRKLEDIVNKLCKEAVMYIQGTRAQEQLEFEEKLEGARQ